MEQWTHKPLVLGSNPSLAIVFINKEQLGSRFTPKGHYTNSSLAIFIINKEQLGSGFTPRGVLHKSLPRHHFY